MSINILWKWDCLEAHLDCEGETDNPDSEEDSQDDIAGTLHQVEPGPSEHLLHGPQVHDPLASQHASLRHVLHHACHLRGKVPRKHQRVVCGQLLALASIAPRRD